MTNRIKTTSVATEKKREKRDFTKSIEIGLNIISNNMPHKATTGWQIIQLCVLRKINELHTISRI